MPHECRSHPRAGLTVAGLARAWAVAVSRSTYLPMSGEEIEQLLTRLIHRLVTAAAGAPVGERAVIDVAAELVVHDFTGSSSIGRSIEVLTDGLPRLAELQHIDRRDATVAQVLGALASGYAEALRQRTLDEKDQITQALFQAKLDAERELQISEARFRQVFSEAAVGIVISDREGTLFAANRVFAGMVGRKPEDLIGAALPDAEGAVPGRLGAAGTHEFFRLLMAAVTDMPDEVRATIANSGPYDRAPEVGFDATHFLHPLDAPAGTYLSVGPGAPEGCNPLGCEDEPNGGPRDRVTAPTVRR